MAARVQLPSVVERRGAVTSSTSWGSLVRAQYRPPRKPRKRGFSVSPEATRGPSRPPRVSDSASRWRFSWRRLHWPLSSSESEGIAFVEVGEVPSYGSLTADVRRHAPVLPRLAHLTWRRPGSWDRAESTRSAWPHAVPQTTRPRERECSARESHEASCPIRFDVPARAEGGHVADLDPPDLKQTNRTSRHRRIAPLPISRVS